MPTRLLVPADGALLAQILDETFLLWGEGLDRGGYERYNRAQRQTAWGRSHLHRLVLVEKDRWLSTAKRYDLRVAIDGEVVPAIGIGAVYTPPPLRRRGHAAELLRRVMAEAAKEGFRLAVLFSEIKPRYYEHLGFRVVPIRQSAIDVPVPRGAPGVAMRSGEARDLRDITEMNRLQAGESRLFVDRDIDYVSFAHTKKRLLAGLSRPGHRRLEFLVVEEGGRAAAYLSLFQVHDSWMVTECGDRDPSGARVGAMLQSVLARGDAVPRRIRAWLPPGFLPPQFRLLARETPPLTMMLRAIGGQPEPRAFESTDVAWWHGDAF